MDKKKKDDVDYAAAYRQFMNFGHGRSLKQFCEDKGYDYGKLQRYSRKAFWSKHTKLSDSEVEESGFMPLLHNEQESPEAPTESSGQPREDSLSDAQSKDNFNEISFIKIRFSDGLAFQILSQHFDNLCEQMMKNIKMNLKNCLNIGSKDSAMDYAFMFSSIESCDINRLSPEAYLRKLILGLHEKKVEKKQLLPCYIRL